MSVATALQQLPTPRPSYYRDGIWNARKVCLFDRLTDPEQHTVASLLETRRYRQGEFVFHMGEQADHLCFVHSGMIKVSLISPRGTERILDIFSAGDVFGEMFISDRNRRTAAAQALSNATVQMLTEAAFLRLLQTLPNLCHTFVRHLIEEQRRTLLRVEALMHTSPGPRLLSVLLDVGQRWGQRVGDDYLLPAPITQYDLASMAALHRSTVSVLINRFRRSRVLGGQGRILKIHTRRVRELLRQADVTLC